MVSVQIDLVRPRALARRLRETTEQLYRVRVIYLTEQHSDGKRAIGMAPVQCQKKEKGTRQGGFLIRMSLSIRRRSCVALL